MLKQTQMGDYFRSMAGIKNNLKENCMQQSNRNTPFGKKGKQNVTVSNKGDLKNLPYDMNLISDDDSSDEFTIKKTTPQKKKIIDTTDSVAELPRKRKPPRKTLNSASKATRNTPVNRRKKNIPVDSDASPSKKQRLVDTPRPSTSRSIMDLLKPTAVMALNTPKKIDGKCSKTPSHMTSLQNNDPTTSTIPNSEETFTITQIINLTDDNVQQTSTSSQTITYSANNLGNCDEGVQLSQKSTQSEDEYFSTNFISDVDVCIVVQKKHNLSQTSDTTEEYDSTEYEEVVQGFSSISDNNSESSHSVSKTALNNKSSINKGIVSSKTNKTSGLIPANVSKESENPTNKKINIINVEQVKISENEQRKQISRTKPSVSRNIFADNQPQKKVEISIQTDMDRIEDSILYSPRQLNMGTQVTSAEILEAISRVTSETPAKSNSIIKVSETPLKSTDVTKKVSETPLKSIEMLKKIPQTPLKSFETPKKVEFASTSKTSNSAVKKDEKSLKNDDPKKMKTDNRYSEENHERLCINVHKIGDWVLTNFGTLFSAENVQIFKSLMSLNKSYKVFCFRLFTRIYKWYNLEDICRTLNIDLDSNGKIEMLRILVGKKILETDYSKEQIPVLLTYLNRPQIKDICVESRLNKTPNKKEAMISALIQNTNRQMTLSSLKSSDDILRDRIIRKLGDCVKLTKEARDILHKIHMLYSLANADLKTPNDIYFLLNKIHFEKIKYPKVQIDAVNIFETSHDLDRYVKAILLRNDFENEMSNKENENMKLLSEEAFRQFKEMFNNKYIIDTDKEKPLFLRRYSAAWIYCSVVSSGALNLGKHYPNEVCTWLNHLLKQKIYCPNKRGKWYEQMALVRQSHLKDLQCAVDDIIWGLNDKLVNEVSKHELSIRGTKVRKGKLSEEKYNALQEVLLPIFGQFPSRTFQANIVHDNVPGRKKKYIRNTEDGKEYGSVEETAINFYLEDKIYTNGIHCEGRLLSTLFCLLFWDIIYSTHVPNTFISEIQCYPLDMFSGEFYKNRKSAIDKRLNEIENVWTLDRMCEFISSIMHEHLEELQVLIPYDFGDEETLSSIVKCIGTRVLGAICKRFVEDYRLFRPGLPDLFLWNPKEKKCCFVEVKGEKDKLSTKQILWLNYLRSVGAKIELCHIQDIGSRSARKISPKKND